MKHITQPRQGESSKWISKTITTKLKSSKKVGVFVQNLFERENYWKCFLITSIEKVQFNNTREVPASLEGWLELRRGVWSPWLQVVSSLQAPAQGLTTSMLGTAGPAGEDLLG